jgi:HSP20 family protein
MELMKWKPQQDVFGLSNQLDRVFDRFFYPSPFRASASPQWQWRPSVDVHESDTAYVIEADLPGMEKKDISVDVDGSVLKLKGERSSEKEVKEDSFYRRERSFGTFQRAFSLPDHVDPESIRADFKDGVLKIEVPKPEKLKPRQITVH